MIRIGPVTIMSTRTRNAYADLARAAYDLHQTLWYANPPIDAGDWKSIMSLDAQLAGAISHTPPEDIQ